MPLYSYKAKDKENKLIDDVVQASSRKEAASIIESNKYKVLTLKNMDSKFNKSFGSRITVAEKATFCRFMATMLRAGLPLPEAIDNIIIETKNLKLKNILLDVSFQIRKGSTFSSVLLKYKNDFNTFFVTLLKAGEKTGTIDQSFDYLARQLLASHELNQKVKGALMYPVIITVAMAANAIVMVAFVLPKLSSVFLDLGVDMPRATEIMLGFGKFVGDNTLLSVGGMLVFGGGVVALFVIRPTRAFLFRVFLKVPAFKKLIVNIDVSRYSRTFATLMRSGVPITVALEVASGTLTHPKLKEKASALSEGVSRGEQLSALLVEGKRVFPSVMIQTIRAGEKSGSIGEVLDELADFYEKEVEYSLKSVTALIEPILMIVIGLGVGGMVLMMITPIYSIVGGFDQTLQ